MGEGDLSSSVSTMAVDDLDPLPVQINELANALHVSYKYIQENATRQKQSENLDMM